MRYGSSVYQRAYPKRYNPIYGRRTLSENTGFFKEAGRVLGITGLLGIDPQSTLLTNRTIPMKYDANAVIAGFLDRYKGVTEKDIQVFSDNGKNYIHIGDSPFNRHQLIKRDNQYDIVTYNQYFQESQLPLRIIAKDNDELRQKLALVFNNPMTRAKLELKVKKVSFLHGENFLPGHGRHVLLNDTKIIANSYIQEFDSSNLHNAVDEYDTALGSVSASQINYHVANGDANYRLSKRKEDGFTTIQDDFWTRMNALTEHVLSSYITDDLLGNIINMYDTKNHLLPEQRSQMVQRLRHDYVYNQHGKGTVNNRKRGESPDAISYDIKNNSVWKQFEFTANPLRGGRVWRDIPFSLEQTVLAMYTPTADGKRRCKYDIDAERFKAGIKKLKVTPADRQFMGSYGRKILGTYVILKLLDDEIASINLSDSKNKEYNHKKWSDLNQLQDELFEAAGDMRDSLRYSTNSFGQLKESVTKNIPNFAENKNAANIQKASEDKQEFVTQTKNNVFDYIKNYTYLENFMGWHLREDLGGIMCNDMMKKVYDKPVPKIRAATASIILMEGIDNISRELKLIETAMQRDTNGKGVVSHLLDKIRLGDLQGFYDFATWDKNRLIRGLNVESHFRLSKLQTLQGEGVIMEQDHFAPASRPYLGENQGFFVANTPATRIIYKFAQKMTQNLIDFMQLSGTHIKKIQAEMREKNLTDIYKTDGIKQLDDVLRKTAKAMTTDYIHDKRNAFAVLNPDELEKVHFEISKKMYRFLQIGVNVSALLANAPDVVYEFK